MYQFFFTFKKQNIQYNYTKDLNCVFLYFLVMYVYSLTVHT